MRDDRLLEMRVFKAVCETGGFTSAASLLGVSQPFVSQSIHNLERRLGVQLLHRSTRKQRLTGEGTVYLASCRRLLEEVEQAEDQVRSDEPAGDLRVSAPLAFGMDQVVPQLPAFLEKYPRINLHLSLSDALVNLLEENFDVAIRMGRLHDSSLTSRRLCKLQRVVVAAPAYVARHGAPVTPRGLDRHNCLMWQSPMERLNRWPFVMQGEREEISVRGNFRSSDGPTLYQLCLAGVGIMRLAEHLATPAIREGRLVPLLTDYQAQDDTAIHALFLPERKLVPRIRAFVDHFAETFETPPWTAA
ncbi:LysR family transcriptional regulator [Ramlibacter rhizophilus]|uniref:LysR family transcriptional regulator n=1 Tax=Ramlibacter rhizophilus TaxID=1781167 RepID=A0A4Z0BKR6_9BURK|nr:LysR family transcriptional regulator [Ramlibacter rhizophilus]TFY98694.1 LysR family transcriptional regulator [Ramlibacter rhizophilus]